MYSNNFKNIKNINYHILISSVFHQIPLNMDLCKFHDLIFINEETCLNFIIFHIYDMYCRVHVICRSVDKYHFFCEDECLSFKF